MKIAVIGAGLAGCECAWLLAEYYGVSVVLFEMKKIKKTPAQVSPHLFAELVCSNSFKSKSFLNPAGTLKTEMALLGSLVVQSALRFEVPAGETLAVDREQFSDSVTQTLKNHKNITVVNAVVEKIEQIYEHGNFSAAVIATGPLTDDSLAEDLKRLTGSEDLYFYDAIAPIIEGDSIDKDIAFLANRKSKTHVFEEKRRNESNVLLGLPSVEDIHDQSGDYLNLPLTKEEYFGFVEKVLQGPKVPHRSFEEPRYFNGCQPIEVLAERGPKTLAFGPMKPIGLLDPRTGKKPYAVVQLRKEKLGDSAWNMVGFQTRLTWTAQKEILRTLPGLQNAEFFRMGSMHRNTYLVSPRILMEDFSLKNQNNIYLAGQIMGVEGYLESAAMGLFIGHVIGHKYALGKKLSCPPANTSLGCLARYCLSADAKSFTPMNIHWGLFENLSDEDLKKFTSLNLEGVLPKKMDKSVKREALAKRSQYLFQEYIESELGLKLLQSKFVQ